MWLVYLHPDDTLVQKTIDWKKATLLRRKRLFSSQKIFLEEIEVYWNEIRDQYSEDYLSALKAEYIKEYGGNIGSRRFSLQVQIRWRWEAKTGHLILHTRSNLFKDKNDVSIQIPIPEAFKLLMTKNRGNTEHVPYVKVLNAHVVQNWISAQVTKYLWHHMGIYHTYDWDGETYWSEVVPHKAEYHGLQGWTRERVQHCIDFVKDITSR